MAFRARAPSVAAVTKLCIFVGVIVAGYAGWALGEMLALEFLWTFLLSGVGSVIGVWAGWKVAQQMNR